MEIGLREWLIVIGIIVIAGILFDGWRRMRGSKGKLKFRLDRNLSNLPDDDSDPELIGPARVVPPSQDPAMSAVDEEALAITPRAAKVPLDPKSVEPKKKKRKNEPSQGDLDFALENDDGMPVILDEAFDEPADDLRDDESEAAFDEVLVINVISRDPDGFKGPALLQNILESGLRFGKMDIFHRHESMAGNGEVLFSMANGVKPGTFDLDDIDLFSTRAVSFFLGLPGPRHPKQAFDVMVAAARKLSSELNGELKDDQRSVLTAQTIEHYRQRIVEFERRGLTMKR